MYSSICGFAYYSYPLLKLLIIFVELSGLLFVCVCLCVFVHGACVRERTLTIVCASVPMCVPESKCEIINP